MQNGGVPSGEELARLLDATGWTRGQLASVLHVHRYSVRRWLRAGPRPAPMSPLARATYARLLAHPDVQAALARWETRRAQAA